MQTKEDIRNHYLKQELTTSVLLEHIIDLKYEIELLKEKKSNVISIQKVTNDYVPEIDFTQYLNTHILSNVENYLEIALEVDLLKGMKMLFKKNMIENMPIKCVNNKNSSFFIYGNDEWKKINSEELGKFLSNVANEFVVIFNTNWIQKYQDKLQNDEEFYNKYMIYFEKIVGSNQMQQEKLISQMKKYLSSLLSA